MTFGKDVNVAPTSREVVWEFGKVKLYRFKSSVTQTIQTPILIVYSLVNRWYMMDLQEDRSFIRNLLNGGADVYLLDTDYPKLAEKYKTLEDYIEGDIHRAVGYIQGAGHSKVNLLGVCQGGTLAVVYAALYPKNIKNLITMILPLDFEIEEGLLFTWARDSDIDNIVSKHASLVPGSFLEHAFKLLKPTAKFRKYEMVPQLLENEDKLQNFLRMERWISDNPDQAGTAYKQYVKEFYQGNKLIRGQARIANKKIDLKKITMPLLNIYASGDYIVPPSSSKPITQVVASQDKSTYEFGGGHIGLYVGSKSQKELAPKITSWLKERD